MIKRCSCKVGDKDGRSDKALRFQDAKYGEGMRVMNPIGKDKKGVRCTVCGQEHTRGDYEKDNDKKTKKTEK